MRSGAGTKTLDFVPPLSRAHTASWRGHVPVFFCRRCHLRAPSLMRIAQLPYVSIFFLIRPLGAGGARDPEGARLAPKINDLSDFVPAVRHTLHTCVSSKSHMLTYAAGKGGKKEGGGEGKEGAGGVGRGTAGGGHWMVSDDDEDDDADDDDGSMILIRKLQQGVYHS